MQRHDSLALLTDLYQLTMAYGYWKEKTADQSAVFHLFFRKCPFGGGYAIAAGLEPVLDYIENFQFGAEDVAFLETVTGNDGKAIFDRGFLDYLAELKLDVDVDAIVEGTLVFAHEPLLRVKGKILHCQILETAMLNMINFQTLVATKAARVTRAAHGDSVLEFGLRRAQGIDGALAASRAAYIGGCHATSNVLAGRLYGIPVRGTHAHSWVMSFDSELEAFNAYADAMPNNCVFLVDTYDTLQGVRHAIEVGQALKAKGYKMVGIRLDSGDLAVLSIEARRMLDQAGFHDAVIVASNDLDERLIESLKRQGAQIAVWGVGTKLITAYDQPALGGVYKLGAHGDDRGNWHPKIKLSEQLIKTSTPGVLQVRRFSLNGKATADMIYNELQPLPQKPSIVDPFDATNQVLPTADDAHDLLVPVVRSGKVVYQRPKLNEVRQYTLGQLNQFPDSVLRFDNPQEYFVGLESSLHQLKFDLVLAARRKSKQIH
jgi:nicotinate phosphoribosyltransferase